MFEDLPSPRVIGVPPGADFPLVLVRNILAAQADRPPEDLARMRMFVNTRRMGRRLVRLFSEDAARLLPRIMQIADADAILPGGDLPLPARRLRRKLELSQLTTSLVENDPSLAGRGSAMDLADSLAFLLDEMQGEGVDLADIRNLNVDDASLHWARSLRFLDIAGQYLENISSGTADDEARRRLAVDRLIDNWATRPPETPVIVAGSTGSRSTTRKLMCAVAKLPMGAVLLPGFDFDLPREVWKTLANAPEAEDHPQYRFARFLAELDVDPEAVLRWGAAPDAERNRVVSLSLRPAQVTDQWLSEGPVLADLRMATRGMALIEAAQPKDEALSIAVALRDAVEKGQRAALITPDRTLARRVATALERWKIVPDDSAGVPLSLTPPGRFIRQVGQIIGKAAPPDLIIALLKHPLCRTGQEDRGPHLLFTRRLELFLRRNAVPHLTESALGRFAQDIGDEGRAWLTWLKDVLDGCQAVPVPVFSAAVIQHRKMAELIASGSGEGSGKLWDTAAGRACNAVLETFSEDSDFSGQVEFHDYLKLCEAALVSENDRVLDNVRRDVMIWGTLEARVQGADLVVLGGLNEGTWPEPTNPDPWLNRQMRRDLGLLAPEQQIGLAAHDYQQAVAAKNVILSRASQGDDGEAVPSRWLNRFTNLLDGLPSRNGPEALKEMRARGDRLVALADSLDRPSSPVASETRPAPAPPTEKRPKKLSVTEIKTLIRDPYAIYAKHILHLRPLLPLTPQPDARLKGIVFHRILETFFAAEANFADSAVAKDALFRIADGELARHVPWHATRLHWRGHLAQIADHLVNSEQARRRDANVVAAEVKGSLKIGAQGHLVVGTADRIDRLNTGDLVIYDYKTGAVPSPRQVKYFDKQLLIEAVMAEAGGFDGVPAETVRKVVHLHLGRAPKDSVIALEDAYETVTVSGELARLLETYASESTGYVSRRAMEKVRYEGDYDHLARFGEWDATVTPRARPLK